MRSTKHIYVCATRGNSDEFKLYPYTHTHTLQRPIRSNRMKIDGNRITISFLCLCTTRTHTAIADPRHDVIVQTISLPTSHRLPWIPCTIHRVLFCVFTASIVDGPLVLIQLHVHSHADSGIHPHSLIHVFYANLSGLELFVRELWACTKEASEWKITLKGLDMLIQSMYMLAYVTTSTKGQFVHTRNSRCLPNIESSDSSEGQKASIFRTHNARQ